MSIPIGIALTEWGVDFGSDWGDDFTDGAN